MIYDMRRRIHVTSLPCAFIYNNNNNINTRAGAIGNVNKGVIIIMNNNNSIIIIINNN